MEPAAGNSKHPPHATASKPLEKLAQSAAEGDAEPGRHGFLVQFDNAQDPMCPQSMSRARKWLLVSTISLGSVCVQVPAPKDLLQCGSTTVD